MKNKARYIFGVLLLTTVVALGSAGVSGAKAAAADEVVTTNSSFETVSAPTNVKATPASPTTVKITWNAAPGTSFVQVWRTNKANAEQKDYVLLGTYHASDGNSTSKLLTPNKTYYYKLRGYTKLASGKNVYSGYSAVVSATPSVNVAAPVSLRVTGKTSSSISLQWNAVSGNNIMYEVWRLSSVTNTPGVCLGRYSNTAKVSTNLKPGTTYYYRVRAYYYYYDGGGQLHRVYGPYSSIVSARTTAVATPTPSPTPTPAACTGPGGSCVVTRPTQTSTSQATSQASSTYIYNKSTGKLHRPGCASAARMKSSNRQEIRLTEAETKSYDRCKNCFH